MVYDLTLTVILDQTGGLPKQQSAYRRWHSTETALLKIYNDFLQAADRGEVSALYARSLGSVRHCR